MINELDREYLLAFGQNLKKIREANSYSQEFLGLEAGLGKNQVWLIENGKVNVTLSSIKKLSDALKISPKDLLDF